MFTQFRPLLTVLLASALMVTAANSRSSFADEPAANVRPQRLLLIGQGPDGSHKPSTHEYFAGINVLARLLREQPKLDTIVVSADGSWSDGPQLLDRADAAVIFVSEGAKWLSADPARLAAFHKLAKRGGGLGALHWATGTKSAEPIAAYVQLFGASHGGPDRRYQEFDAVTPQLATPDHPILRGVKPFAAPVREEFYFALKQASKSGDVTLADADSAITPLVRIPVENVSGTVSWAWERPDHGRSFGFTGLHYHDNWKHESYRRLLAQAVLWILKRDVPTAGLGVSVSDQELALAAPATKAPAAAATTRDSGIDPDGFDKSVRAQDDLFLHVNGRWLQRTEIPADKSNYGSFNKLIDEAQLNIRAIIEEVAKNPTDENGRKVGNLFNSYMNEDLAEQLGLKPLQAEIGKIQAIANKQQVLQRFGYSEIIGVGSPIGFFVDQDDKDSTKYLANVIQSGTTLPDRDYYLKDDARYVKAREALKGYIETLFRLSNQRNGAEAAEAVLKLETKLAEVQWDRTQLRDAEKRYNKFVVAKLSDLTPKLAWSVYFQSVDAAELKELNVATPSYFQGLEKIIDETPLETWKWYLHFRLIDSYASVLTKELAFEHFKLHGKELGGIPEQQPRWKRAVDTVAGGGSNRMGVLGEAVGQLYVAKHFKPQARERMDQLVRNLLKAFEQSIHELSWMTDATKKQALVKLSKITPKIGYPTKWRDYSKLEIKADDLVGNMVRAAGFEHQRMLDKLGKPVDRAEWHMTPQTVNAYYNPGLNEIVFPAAILQPPFFDADADDAVNYGGIGAVIGHEISHGFDDQGSKYDGDGNLKNWWTEADQAAFEKLTSQLVAQYEGYEALPMKKVNGKLTLGENIADLSGMAIAFKAYRISLGDKEGPTLDGYTSSQRFFLGWGQIWRRKYRDAELVKRLVTDPHSPSHFRANGPITNLDAFYEAFNVKPGDKLFKPKEQRIQIW